MLLWHVQVKGHISKMAMCLLDDEPKVAATARLFFASLGKKAHRGANPVYNLLPDILSNLSRERRLDGPGFGRIMAFLLDFIKADKHNDALKEKLLMRFEAATEPQVRSVPFKPTVSALLAERCKKCMPIMLPIRDVCSYSSAHVA